MELRTYTLTDGAALRRYVEDFWPRHIRTLDAYGITVHAVWTHTDTAAHRVSALVGYQPGACPLELSEKYRRSADFVQDHLYFDVTLIMSTTTQELDPIPCSPLR